MLDRKFAIPILIGVCLGLILAGVRVSAGALSAAVGREPGIALVVFEGARENGAGLTVLGKSLDLPLPAGTLENVLPDPETVLPDSLRQWAGRACGDLAGRVRGWRESCIRFYVRWRGFIPEDILPGS